MKKTILYTALIFIIVLVVAGGGLYINSRIPKTAYVDLNTLYNEFEMKKELEAKMTKTQEARKGILDSLELHLRMLSRSIENEHGKNKERVNEFQMKREEYSMKQQQFGEDNEKMSQQYNEQIWKQLNQYIQDYGKKYGYEYIHGTSGNGSLMYANDRNNITQDMIQFVNNRYKGHSK